MSGASEHERFDERDEELERLCGLVRDLELEARGRRRGRDRDDREEGSISGGGRYRARSHQSGSHQHRERSRSREYANWDSVSPEKRQPQNTAMDAMSRALCKAARSPFSDDIEWAPIPSKFTRPPFNSYDGKTLNCKNH